MWNICNVVMLPTKSKGKLWLDKDNELFKHDIDFISKKGINQHIYITSDEEIKDDEWYYNYTSNKIYKFSYGGLLYDGINKKVIATTDTSLTLENAFIGSVGYLGLPQIPQQFIQYYIAEYNKGNVCTKVEVEYIDGAQCRSHKRDGSTIDGWIDGELKVNTDNTINIKPTKDSWSREDLYSIMQQYHDYCMWKEYITPMKWIEENL